MFEQRDLKNFIEECDIRLSYGNKDEYRSFYLQAKEYATRIKNIGSLKQKQSDLHFACHEQKCNFETVARLITRAIYHRKNTVVVIEPDSTHTWESALELLQEHMGKTPLIKNSFEIYYEGMGRILLIPGLFPETKEIMKELVNFLQGGD